MDLLLHHEKFEDAQALIDPALEMLLGMQARSQSQHNVPLDFAIGTMLLL